MLAYFDVDVLKEGLSISLCAQIVPAANDQHGHEPYRDPLHRAVEYLNNRRGASNR